MYLLLNAIFSVKIHFNRKTTLLRVFVYLIFFLLVSLRLNNSPVSLSPRFR